MRIIFLGTPEFAVPSLETLVQARHHVVAVLTQPDRPKGRSQAVALPPAKETALRLGLAVHQPERIRTPEVIAFLRQLEPEGMVVVGYGKIIPQSIIDIPPRGIINVHASLLPKYRGAAPIQWAIASGETITGVTTMRIDAGLDTGDILLAQETVIGPEETAVELSPRLAALGADLLIETLSGLAAGSIIPRKQENSQATFAPVLRKEDGMIEWTRTAPEIYNRVRGFLPWPGCYTRFRGRLLQIWKARVAENFTPGEPGAVQPGKSRLVVNCGGATALEVLEVQPEGKRRMPAVAFLSGYHLVHNESLGVV